MDMKICEMPLESRPRERMLKLGVKVLSDAELLAIILQKGTPEENVVDMCNRLLGTHGDLSKLSLRELQKVSGIGPAKAMQITALFEFAKRHSSSRLKGKPVRRAQHGSEWKRKGHGSLR